MCVKGQHAKLIAIRFEENIPDFKDIQKEVKENEEDNKNTNEVERNNENIFL